MPIKDADRKREANRLRQQRFRAKRKGVTTAVIPPVGVTTEPVIGEIKEPELPNYRMIWLQGRWVKFLI